MSTSASSQAGLVVIQQPQRILRLIRRFCSARWPVLVRLSKGASIAVRGYAAGVSVDPSSAASMGFYIHGLSQKALAHLVQAQTHPKNNLFLEIITASAQVRCQTPFKGLRGAGVWVGMPQVLESWERRKNTRLRVPMNSAAFIEGDELQSSPPEARPPTLPYMRPWETRVLLADISQQGMCLSSVFAQGLWTRDQQTRLLLYLPMQPPVPVRVTIRWTKRVKEPTQVGDSGGPWNLVTYRYGCEFIDLEPQVLLALKRYMHQLNTAGAL